MSVLVTWGRTQDWVGISKRVRTFSNISSNTMHDVGLSEAGLILITASTIRRIAIDRRRTKTYADQTPYYGDTYSMLVVTRAIAIQESELEEKFIRAPGPGGQNVNKVASAVQLRFHAKTSPAIPEHVYRRLRTIASHLMTQEGEIVITANQYRSQERNRQDARDRLSELIRQATYVPKVRRPTKPSRAAKAKRTDQKKQRGAIKKNRAPVKYP